MARPVQPDTVVPASHEERRRPTSTQTSTATARLRSDADVQRNRLADLIESRRNNVSTLSTATGLAQPANGGAPGMATVATVRRRRWQHADGYADRWLRAAAVPPNMIAGAPQWGMPITGTPIGLPGPPHVPLGTPAGLQKHVMKNRTRVMLPPPVSKMEMSVKQRPGLNYPRPVNHVDVDETQREPFRLLPAWLTDAFHHRSAGTVAARRTLSTVRKVRGRRSRGQDQKLRNRTGDTTCGLTSRPLTSDLSTSTFPMTTVLVLARSLRRMRVEGILRWAVLVVLASGLTASAQDRPVHWLNAGAMPPGAIGSLRLAAGRTVVGVLPAGADPSAARCSDRTGHGRWFLERAIERRPGRPADRAGVPAASGRHSEQRGLELYPTIELIDRLYPPPGLGVAVSDSDRADAR